MKIFDDNNGGSAYAPPTYGYGLYPPPAIYQFPQLDAMYDNYGGSTSAPPPTSGYGLYPPPAIYQFPQLDAMYDIYGGSTSPPPPTYGYGLYPPPAIFQFPQLTSSHFLPTPAMYHIPQLTSSHLPPLYGLNPPPGMAALNDDYSEDHIGNFADSDDYSEDDDAEVDALDLALESANFAAWLRGDKSSHHSFNHTCYIYGNDYEVRRITAECFRREYTYGSVNDGCMEVEQRTCIWPGGTSSWQDKSSGIMWVGLQGIDSICVVTKSDCLDRTRLCGSLLYHHTGQNVLSRFRQSVIIEIEDLAAASCEIGDKMIEKPFGVVSVIPGTYESHNGRAEYGEAKAVEFLQDKVKSDTVFTVTETIQTAIAAFGHLFQKKFKADEIQVSVMNPNATVFGSVGPTDEDLNMGQINEHLAVINKPRPRSN